MKCRGLAVVLALVLAACGEQTPAADPNTRIEVREAEPTPAAGPEAQPVTGPERRILAFGDSLFAGYRVGRSQSYPAQLEKALRAQGRNVRVTNAGVSGDTSAAGLQRIEFVVDGMGPRPDLAIVELGGNDLLRGIPPAETRENIAAILAELKERNIPVVLMGMRAPPNLGEAYVKEFDGLYPELAERYGAALVPFFLEAIYDKPALIQNDRIHPTAEGIQALVTATADEVAGALGND